jgi:hypothetical protein
MTARWHRPDWEAFANSKGFTYQASNDLMPTIWDEICVIEGTLSGRSVRAAAFLQKGLRQRAVVKASIRPLGLGLRPSGIASSIAVFFGAQDVEIGDPAFDKTIVVKAVDPERAKAILGKSSWLREELTTRASAGSDFTIGEGGVVVETEDESIDNVKSELDWVARIADELERADG